MRALARQTANRGFTLLELAIVMTISSLIMVAGIKMYDLYSNSTKRSDTLDKVSTIDTALSNFYSSNGRYPCPADPTLPMKSNTYGKEAATVNATTGKITCTIASIVGARKTNAPGPAGNDPVTIGSVPFTTLGITLSDAIDPWGYKIQYAVTTYLTDSLTFDNTYGAVRVTTEPPTSLNLTDPVDSAHYAVVAFGPDHMGAYSSEGKKPVACTAGKNESSNCNGGSTFVEGISSNSYDDTVSHSTRYLTSLWDFTSPNSVDIHNLNTGNVGVGVDIPTARLDVAGNIRATNAQQPLFCDDSTPQKCWDPANFATTAGSNCAVLNPPPPAALCGSYPASRAATSPASLPPFQNLRQTRSAAADT